MKKRKTKPAPKFIYEYQEPKTEEERKIQENNVSQAYDVLFSETLRRINEKDPGGFWSTF